jgi:Asp-tRNA(Asn)/Glu-tRNA(Gln) amidotransferase A subunit family amidase
MTGAAFKTIPELGRLIRSGAVSPTQLAQEALTRLDTIGLSLNAVVTLTADLAMEQARIAEDELAHGVDRGPLHGIPYGAKDLLATVGIPTSWGMGPYRDQLFDFDATVIERLREAGAVLVAKLAMVEGAGGFGYEQPDAAFTGPGKSAWNPDAWSGGSSSGSGSAVGAGCVPFAIGTETWGSILVPAAFNGITGFRPTYGTVSRRGAMSLSWTMDKIGPMCRTAEDCATVLAAIAGSDPHDLATHEGWFEPPRANPDGYTFAVLREAADAAQPEVRASFEASLDVLGSIGTLEEVSLPDYPWDAAAGLVIMAEAASAFEEFMLSAAWQALTAPEDRAGMAHGLTVPAVDYLRALRVRRKGSRELDALLSRYDGIVAPALPYVATPLTDRFENWSSMERGPSLSGAGNLCGLPSITVPNGFGERGLPTGLEMMSRAYNDGRVLAAAMRFQELTGWHTRQPELSVAR